MESILDVTILVEAVLLSFLLSLWITWLALRGLFRLMPAIAPLARPLPQPVAVARVRQFRVRRSEAA